MSHKFHDITAIKQYVNAQYTLYQKQVATEETKVHAKNNEELNKSLQRQLDGVNASITALITVLQKIPPASAQLQPDAVNDIVQLYEELDKFNSTVTQFLTNNITVLSKQPSACAVYCGFLATIAAYFAAVNLSYYGWLLWHGSNLSLHAYGQYVLSSMYAPVVIPLLGQLIMATLVLSAISFIAINILFYKQSNTINDMLNFKQHINTALQSRAMLPYHSAAFQALQDELPVRAQGVKEKEQLTQHQQGELQAIDRFKNNLSAVVLATEQPVPAVADVINAKLRPAVEQLTHDGMCQATVVAQTAECYTKQKQELQQLEQKIMILHQYKPHGSKAKPLPLAYYAPPVSVIYAPTHAY